MISNCWTKQVETPKFQNPKLVIVFLRVVLFISIIKIKGLDLSVVSEQSVSLEGEEVGVDGREADSEGRKLSTRIIASHMQPFNYLKLKKKKKTFSVIFQDKKIKHCLFSLSYEYLFTAHIRKGDTLFSFSHFTGIWWQLFDRKSFCKRYCWSTMPTCFLNPCKLL